MALALWQARLRGPGMRWDHRAACSTLWLAVGTAEIQVAAVYERWGAWYWESGRVQLAVDREDAIRCATSVVAERFGFGDPESSNRLQ